MEHVRFPLLSREYLVQRVDNTGDDLFNRHPVCKDYVIEALKFHLLTATMPSSSAKCLAAASGLEYFWYQSSPSYFNNFFAFYIDESNKSGTFYRWCIKQPK